MIRIVVLLLSLGAFVSSSAAEEPVTVSTLLDEMVRLDRWCRLPSPAYQVVLRSSREPQQMVGQERILFDEAGPGALNRVVVSRAGRGRLRVYIDDAPEAVIQGMLDRRSNAFVEAMNGLLQQAKRAARGFRTTENFIVIAYLRMSKLKHLPAHPFCPAGAK